MPDRSQSERGAVRQSTLNQCKGVSTEKVLPPINARQRRPKWHQAWQHWPIRSGGRLFTLLCFGPSVASTVPGTHCLTARTQLEVLVHRLFGQLHPRRIDDGLRRSTDRSPTVVARLRILRNRWTTVWWNTNSVRAITISTNRETPSTLANALNKSTRFCLLACLHTYLLTYSSISFSDQGTTILLWNNHGLLTSASINWCYRSSLVSKLVSIFHEN